MDNFPHKGVSEEKDRQGDRGQNRSFPGGEENAVHILDLFGRGERTHVHRDEVSWRAIQWAAVERPQNYCKYRPVEKRLQAINNHIYIYIAWLFRSNSLEPITRVELIHSSL